MIPRHFLFGPSDHLPYERRMIHFAEAPKEDVPPVNINPVTGEVVPTGVTAPAASRLREASVVVGSPHAPRLNPYDKSCCATALKPRYDACAATPECPPGFRRIVSEPVVRERVAGYCHDAAERRCYDMGRLPSAPAREPRAGDRRVWPRDDGSRGVGYQMFTMDKGWVWSTDYNPIRDPNRWKGITMKDPSPSMMRDYGRSGGGDRSTGGDSRGGFAVYRSDDAERTTYATGADRPDYRRPLSSYSAKDRQTEKILRESETPLSRARERVIEATYSLIRVYGDLGRFDGSKIRMQNTFQKDFASMWNAVHAHPLHEHFHLNEAKNDILSDNKRFAIQVFSDLGDDFVHRRVYALYDRKKGSAATIIASDPSEILNVLNNLPAEELTTEWSMAPLGEEWGGVQPSFVSEEGFRTRTPNGPELSGKSVLRNKTPETEKPAVSEAPRAGTPAPEKSFVLPPEFTPENSMVIPSGAVYIMFREPDGNVRMMKFNGTDRWAAINGANATFFKEKGIRMYVETYQEDGRTLHRHHVLFTKPGRYEVGTKDPQQRDKWYPPKTVRTTVPTNPRIARTEVKTAPIGPAPAPTIPESLPAPASNQPLEDLPAPALEPVKEEVDVKKQFLDKFKKALKDIDATPGEMSVDKTTNNHLHVNVKVKGVPFMIEISPQGDKWIIENVTQNGEKKSVDKAKAVTPDQLVLLIKTLLEPPRPPASVGNL